LARRARNETELQIDRQRLRGFERSPNRPTRPNRPFFQPPPKPADQKKKEGILASILNYFYFRFGKVGK
jgi:hypothetical protein